MSTVPTLLLLGLTRQELFVVAGAFAGVVSTLAILAVLGLSLAPVLSRDWADQLGVDDVASGGDDPAEVIDGCPEPIPPREDGRDVGGVTESEPDVSAGTGSEPPTPTEVAGSDSSA